MTRKTKAELEIENQALRESVASGTVIQNCRFEGSPNAETCEAVRQIAAALEVAARALQGNPSLVINENTETY